MENVRERGQERLEVFDSVFFVEQVAFRFIISRNPHRSLPKERYLPCLFFPDPDCGKDIITEKTAHLHFMGDKSNRVHDLYQHYAKRDFEDLRVFESHPVCRSLVKRVVGR